MKASNQAGPMGFLGHEHLAGVRPLQRLTDADEAGKEPTRRRFGHDAALGEHETDLGAGRRHADVHRQGHRDADADGVTIDRPDHGLA